MAVSVTLRAMLVQYRKSLSGVYLPSLKIISGIWIELLKIPHVATCLPLYSGTVFLQREKVLLKIQQSVSKDRVCVTMCTLCFWQVEMLKHSIVLNLIF